MQTVKLFMTVSGGLEGLAENQARACFGDRLSELQWHRKPSGSQLYLTLHSVTHDAASMIASSMTRLDYVEYVFLLLDSFRIASSEDSSSGDDNQHATMKMLQEMESVTSRVSQSSLDFCKRLCEAVCAGQSTTVDAGLEGLPGILMPTPEIITAPSSSDSHLHKAGFGEFQVNTIYTKPNVAQAVIQQVSDFYYQKYNHNSNKEILWVDAGSGNGALLQHMPPASSIGIDTHPTSPRVHRMDFLEVTKYWLQQEFPNHEMRIVVSNPPFAISSRGDYAPIVQFINHSLDALDARVVAVICPSKFARERIWKSLELTEKATLLCRFFLPQNAFYNPSTGEQVHIHSYCLIFGQEDTDQCSSINEKKSTIVSKSGVYLSAKRDKGLFSNLATADLTKSVALGLTKAGMEFVAERNARYMLNARLMDQPTSLELWGHVNPQMPCSLVNSNSIRVPNHSLGWLSMSVKPPVALAMASMALNDDTDGGCSKSKLAINLMSGEGTIELEASRAVKGRPLFLICGDKSHANALKTAKRVQTLDSNGNRCHPRSLVDVVVWDAQQLPLRRGIADAIMADLPFQGSLKKTHQEPQVGTKVQSTMSTQPSNTSSSLSYSKVLGEATRILKAKGRAALLSPDSKALRHASNQFHWNQLGYSTSVNLGGLNAKLFLMERREACAKDLSMWVPSATSDLSSSILNIANKVCENERNKHQQKISTVINCYLLSTFFHEEKSSLSHCYRMVFDDMVRNVEAKRLEQLIRQQLAVEVSEEGIILR